MGYFWATAWVQSMDLVWATRVGITGQLKVWGMWKQFGFKTNFCISHWTTGTIKSVQNELLAAPVCSVPMVVQTTVTGLLWYWKKLKNMMILGQDKEHLFFYACTCAFQLLKGVDNSAYNMNYSCFKGTVLSMNARTIKNINITQKLTGWGWQ